MLSKIILKMWRIINFHIRTSL